MYQPNRQNGAYDVLCYTRALAGTRNSSMSPPQGIDLMTHGTMSGHSTMELCLAPV